MKLSHLLIISLVVSLLACSLEEPQLKQSKLSTNEKLLFSRLMALGDNIIAGYQSAALTEKHQQRNFVALIARQTGVQDFQQPYLGYPGLGSESYAGYGILRLKYLDDPQTPQTVNPDPVIVAEAFDDYPDFDPVNHPFVSDEVMFWPLPYNNLAVPGIYVDDVYKATTRLRSRSKSGLLDVILRNPLPDPYGYQTAFGQAKLFQPSLILCWIGLYDVLAYAQYSAINPVTSPPTSKEAFSEYFAALMDSLQSTQAAVVVANIPDILDMPYFTTMPTVVMDTVTNTPLTDSQGNPIPLVGVQPGDLVLNPAKIFIKQGYGLPSDLPGSNGQPLPEEVVLSSEEQATVHDLIDGFNTAIDSICQSRKIPVVDMYGFFKQVAAGSEFYGLTISAEFITGGFYSLDGVHPSDLGQALIANEWLQTINQRFGLSVPKIDVPGLLNQWQYADSLLVQ